MHTNTITDGKRSVNRPCILYYNYYDDTIHLFYVCCTEYGICRINEFRKQ